MAASHELGFMKVVREEIRAALGAGEADILSIMAERDDNGCQGIGIITCAVGGRARPCTGVTKLLAQNLTRSSLASPLPMHSS